MPAQVVAEKNEAGSDRYTPAEVLLYQASPVGYWATTLVIFLVAFGSFFAIAQITGRPNFYTLTEDGIVFPAVSWIGFVLSLILTAALALAATDQFVWNRERDALTAALPRNAAADIEALSSGIPMSWRKTYVGLFIGGAAGGLGFNIFLMFMMGVAPLEYLQSIGLWFLLFSPILYGVGFKAGAEVARESREIRALINRHLEVDLFHLDRLHVFGRIGLRGALSWLLMAGILLLFVADPTQSLLALPGVGLAIVGGAFIMTSAIRPVHDKICAAKSAELHRIHEEMADARNRALEGDASASSALAGLTDYEQWVEKRPEWPLGSTVLARFSLYILIPILPIVGSYLFERVADSLFGGGAL